MKSSKIGAASTQDVPEGWHCAALGPSWVFLFGFPGAKRRQDGNEVSQDRRNKPKRFPRDGIRELLGGCCAALGPSWASLLVSLGPRDRMKYSVVVVVVMVVVR